MGAASGMRTHYRLHIRVNEVTLNPIQPGQDIKARFEEWENTVLEIRYTGAIEHNTAIRSVYSLLQHYQPQLAMARDEVHGDMCNLDKYLAAIRWQVELIAEFELMKKPSPKKQGDEKKKAGGKDRRKFKKDDDDTEGELDPEQVAAEKLTNKKKQCFAYNKGMCKAGDKCEYKHDPTVKRQIVMMVEQQVQEAMKGLQVLAPRNSNT